MHNAETAATQDWKAIFGIVDRAPCERDHEALKSSPDWDALPSLGLQETDELPLDLRNCDRCHTTLAKPVPATARAIADIVSRDSRPAIHFALPAGDVAALRGELEERYALHTEVADAWNRDTCRDEKRLVVATTESAALDERQELERDAEWDRNAWEAR